MSAFHDDVVGLRDLDRVSLGDSVASADFVLGSFAGKENKPGDSLDQIHPGESLPLQCYHNVFIFHIPQHSTPANSVNKIFSAGDYYLDMATLSTTEQSRIQHAIDSLVKESAVELPFDEKVIQEVGVVAASSGFESAGQFKEDARNNPISVLLRFIKYLGR